MLTELRELREAWKKLRDESRNGARTVALKVRISTLERREPIQLSLG